MQTQEVCSSPFEKVPVGTEEGKAHFCVYPEVMEPQTISQDYNILEGDKILNSNVNRTIGYLYTIERYSR